MVDEKIIEKEGKQYCTLPDGTNALVENEIINDANWITVHEAEKLLDRGDRQIRNLAAKNSWDKKYALINKKPVRHYYKPQLDNYLKTRVTEGRIVVEDVASESSASENTAIDVVGKSMVSQNTLTELDAVLKKVEPYIENFLITVKSNQDRIISLEEKKSTAEKSAVFWKTSALWLFVICIPVGFLWFKTDHTNSYLLKNNGDLNEKYQSLQKDLYETKLLLNKKDQEINNTKNTPSENTQPSDSTMQRKD